MSGPKPLPDRDRELVGRYLSTRSEGAFRELYRAHTPYLYGLAMRLSGGRSDIAEEAVQEAWVRAARRIEAFQWRSTLRTWLGAIVINCCREQFRGRSREVSQEPPERVVEAPVPGRRVDLERLLARLPDAQRAVLVLHAVEGYTHAEIANLLDIAPGTSKSRLFEARRALDRLASPRRAAGERP